MMTATRGLIAATAALLLAISVLPSRQAEAASTRYIPVIKEGARKARVAVPDLTQSGAVSNGTLARELSETLRFDVDNTGYFRVVEKQQFVNEAHRRDLSQGTINLAEWRALQADLVLKADFAVSGDNVRLSATVYDVATGKRVFAQGLAGSAPRARRVAHEMSNAILKKLVGVDGIATTRIVYVGDGPGNTTHLFLVDYDGHGRGQVTKDAPVGGAKAIAVAPRWSRDGRKIFYTSYHHGYPYLYKIDTQRGVRTVVAKFPGLNASPAVSPDGRRMIFTSSQSGTPELWRLDLGGSKPVRLTRNFGGLAICPSWSPDGSTIAFVSERGGGPQIYLMDPDGGNLRRLLYGYRYTTSLDWSPKGDVIAFSARSGGRLQIFCANMKKNEVWQVTTAPFDHEHPSFAPDGIHVVYVRERNYEADLFIDDIRDPRPVQITTLRGDERYPAWSPKGY